MGTLQVESISVRRQGSDKKIRRHLSQFNISYFEKEKKDKEEINSRQFNNITPEEIRAVCYEVLKRKHLKSRIECTLEQWQEIVKKIEKLKNNQPFEFVSDRILNQNDQRTKIVWIKYKSQPKKEKALALISNKQIIIEPIREGTSLIIVDKIDLMRLILSGETLHIDKRNMKIKHHNPNSKDLEEFLI